MLRTPNSLLALAIPTYNRSAILHENLKEMLPEIREHSIAVYISDDSKDSATEQMVAELKMEYEFIFYRRNEPSNGHDKNFFATLALPDTDFVWYLGDSLYLRSGVIADVLAMANHDPDFIFVNSYAPELTDRTVAGAAFKDFLLNRAWYLTLSGATIYGRRPRSLHVAEERRKQWKNFPQLGLIFEFVSMFSASCVWIGKPSILFNKKKKSYWQRNALDVFVRDWAALVRSFPKLFSGVEADRIIRSHGINTGVFSLKWLITLRANGGLNASEIDALGKDFALASPISPWWAKVVCMAPPFLVRGLWMGAKAIKESIERFR